MNSCTGVISKVLPKTTKILPGFNQIKQKILRNPKTQLQKGGK